MKKTKSLATNAKKTKILIGCAVACATVAVAVPLIISTIPMSYITMKLAVADNDSTGRFDVNNGLGDPENTYFDTTFNKDSSGVKGKKSVEGASFGGNVQRQGEAENGASAPDPSKPTNVEVPIESQLSTNMNPVIKIQRANIKLKTACYYYNVKIDFVSDDNSTSGTIYQLISDITKHSSEIQTGGRGGVPSGTYTYTFGDIQHTGTFYSTEDDVHLSEITYPMGFYCG